MTFTEKLDILRTRLSGAQGECCDESESLAELLVRCDGDVDKASYEGCLINAENSEIKLPDISVGSQREYWLSLARHYRPNNSGTLKRADGEGEG